MIVNKENFTIYSSDDEISIKERIASQLKTTLFWLYFTVNDNSTDFVSSNDITAINILDDLKENLDNFSSFKDVETKYAGWIQEKTDVDASNDLAKMYILLTLESATFDDFTKLVLESFFQDAGGTNYNWDYIETIIDSRVAIKNNLQRDVNDLKKRTDRREEEFKKKNIQLVETNISTTDFIVENIVTTLTIETSEPIVLSHVLNSLEMENVLFARYENFFKVNESKKEILKLYDYEYTNDSMMIVFFKMLKKKLVFREILIKEISPTNFVIDVDTLEDHVDMEELQDIFLGIGFTVTNQSNTKIKGHFYILNNTFHKELFLDEVMNNERFFNMYTNERLKVGKQFSKINLFFYSITSNSISFSIVNENNNVKVKITKVFSQEYLDNFKKLFVILFKSYKQNEKMLLNFYRKFIPGISLILKQIEDDEDDETTVKRKGPTKKNPLALIEPTLFVPLYTRKCAKPPRILNDDENPPNGYDVMAFPKYNEGGLKERRYVCDQTKSFKHPGIRKNTLQNSDVFKYIPCCYETNQVERRGSPWNVYFNGIVDKNDKYAHILYKTSRILPNENKGILPLGLSKMFGNENRKGVFVGPNAFIDCVSRASKQECEDILDQTTREKTLKTIRSKLNINYCLQENSDLSFENLNEWFYDLDSYFEPRRFFRAVENYFQINIYLFGKSEDFVKSYFDKKLVFEKTPITSGVMTLPNMPSKGVFIDPKRYRQSVYIYTHMGGAIDSVKHPHCEYIQIRTEIAKPVSEMVENVYRHMLVFSHKDFYIQDEHNYKHQYVDSTGRCVKLVNQNGKHEKLDRPNLPLGIPVKERNVKMEVDFYDELLSLKRLARIFVEFCLIKYAKSQIADVETFITKETEIDSTFEYNPISPHYKIEYYENVFCRNNKIIFESLDTQKRILYSMKIIEKRNSILRFLSKPYIYSYFQSTQDYDGLVLSEKSFKEYAYDSLQGLAFNNFIDELSTSENVILVRDKTYLDLNGYFGVFWSLDSLKKTFKSEKIDKKVDTFYLFNLSGYEQYTTEGIGRIIIVYKLNMNVYYLGKYCSF